MIGDLEERLDSLLLRLGLPKDPKFHDEILELKKGIVSLMDSYRVVDENSILEKNKIGRLYWLINKLETLSNVRNKPDKKNHIYHTLNDSNGTVNFYREGSGATRYIRIKSKGKSVKVPLPKSITVSRYKNHSGEYLFRMVLELKRAGDRLRVTRGVVSVESFKEHFSNLISILEERTGILDHGGILRPKDYFLDPFE